MPTLAQKPRAPGAIGAPGEFGAPIDTQPAITNLGEGVPRPTQPGPIRAPNLPQSPAPPSLNFTPPTAGPAPTPTPFGNFTAPSLPGGMDPYQWRVDQANKGANRSAAARGTLLSGGFQAALAKLNQGLASEEAQNIYGRARDTYTLNRDTNAQNFGQQMGSYNAGTGAALDAGRLGLQGATSLYDRQYGAGRDAYGDARQDAATNAGVINANQQAQDLFAQQMEQYRAEVERQRQAEATRTPVAPTRTPVAPPPVRRGGFAGGRLGMG